MKNGWKRTLSLLLCLVLLAGMFPTAMAQSPEQSSLTTQAVESTVQGSNSVGKLISNTLEGAEEESGDSPYSVTDITVEGTLATVEYMTDRDAELLVAIYEEESGRMLGSGHSAVAESSSKAEVRIEIESMPAYFVASAYLLDPEDHSPLCEAFVSRYYTREFQAFLATTVEDYDPDRVLNLDEDESTNFLVFGEDTILLEETAGVNELTDNGDGSYTILHADARMKALQPGDSFAYTWQDGSVLVVLVQSASVDGDTVTVTENAEAELEDIFANVKIDGDSDGADLDVDTSEMDDDLVYLGENLDDFSPIDYARMNGLLSRENEINGRTALLRDIGGEFTYKNSLSLSIDKENADGKIKGAVKFSFKCKVEVYVSRDWKYVKSENKWKLELEGSVSGKFLEKRIPLPKVGFSPIAGLYIELSFGIVFEFEMEANLSVEVSIASGFIYDSDTGRTPINSSPKVKAEFKVEGTLFAGLEGDISVAAIAKKILSFTLKVKGGFEAVGTLLDTEFKPDDDVKHECFMCVDGSISAKLSVGLKFELLFGAVDFDVKLVELGYKLTDFYYSQDCLEFGFGKCPYKSYKVTATVLNEQEEPMKDVKILGTGLNTDPKTDEEGTAVFYLENGTYDLRFVGQDLDLNKSITVHNGKKNLVINKGQDNSSPGQHCGTYLNWFLDKDGTLTISGTGEMENYQRSGTNLPPWDKDKGAIKALVVFKGVTGLGENAFFNCTALKKVTLPVTLTEIGKDAFSGCQNITDVYYAGTEDIWKTIKVASGNDALLNATIHFKTGGLVESLQVGNYLSFGSYQGEPLIWQILDIDGESVLLNLVSTTICFSYDSTFHAKTVSKSLSLYYTYGSATWEYSEIRQFLNNAGTISNFRDITFAYDDNGGIASFDWGDPDSVPYTGPGFLAENNFSGKERGLLLPTLHSVLIPQTQSGQQGLRVDLASEIDALASKYDSAPKDTVLDYVFVLSGKEFKQYLVDKGLNAFKAPTGWTYNTCWLRDSVEASYAGYYIYCGNHCLAVNSDVGRFESDQADAIHGIRPACRIDFSLVGKLSGTGIYDDPFVLGNLSQGEGFQELEFEDPTNEGGEIPPLQTISIDSGDEAPAEEPGSIVRDPGSPASDYDAEEETAGSISLVGGAEEPEGTITWISGEIPPAVFQPGSVQEKAAPAKPVSPAQPDRIIPGEDGEQDGMQTASFRGLVPGEPYLFLVARDGEREDLLEAENLLYVDLGVADGYGLLTFSYLPRVTVPGAAVLVCGLPRNCKLSFDCGGGDALAAKMIKSMEAVKLPTPYWREHTFLGWALEKGGEAVYQGGDSISLRDDLTLYALWHNSYCTVTFDTEGGAACSPLTGKWHGTITLPKATRDGYLFRGWALEKGGEAVYQAGDSLALEEDLTLYAVWQEKLETNLSAYAAGTDSTYASIYVPLNEAATLAVDAHVDLGEIHYAWSCELGEGLVLPEDDKTASVTIPKVDGRYTVFCTVTDDYERSKKVSFYVRVDSGLEAYVAGTKDTSLQIENAVYQEPVTLSVDASVKVGSVHYQWHCGSGDSSVLPMETDGPDFTIPSVDQYFSISCDVTDDYGNSKYVFFRVRPASGFRAVVAGTEETDQTVPVTPGGSCTLAVDAHADAGEVHYRWRCYTSGGPAMPDDDTSASITVQNVNQSCWVYCYVTDDFGREIVLTFHLEPNSGLTAYVAGTTNTYQTQVVSSGESVTLSVDAHVDVGAVHYHWSSYEETDLTFPADDTAASFTIPAVSRPYSISCTVKDDYGNSKYISFTIAIENHFSAYAAGTMDTTQSITTQYGKSVTVGVDASADKGAIHYRWHNNYGNTIPLPTDDATTSVTIPSAERNLSFYCIVSDDYGSSQYVYFHISVENTLTAYAAGTLDSHLYKTVALGDSVTIGVDAQTEAGSLQYRWVCSEGDSSVIPEDRSTTSFTIPSVECRYYLYCMVSDDFGHTKYVYFTIEVDNGLTAWVAGTSSFSKYFFEATGPQTLAVDAHANRGDLSYEWSLNTDPEYARYQTIEGADGTSLEIDAVNVRCEYRCKVTDIYGNYEYVRFRFLPGVAQEILLDQPTSFNSDPYTGQIFLSFTPERSGEYELRAEGDQEVSGFFTDVDREDVYYRLPLSNTLEAGKTCFIVLSNWSSGREYSLTLTMKYTGFDSMEELRERLQNCEPGASFTYSGTEESLTLSSDLVIPSGVRVFLSGANLIIQQGATLTVEKDALLYCDDLTAKGKILNGGEIDCSILTGRDKVTFTEENAGLIQQIAPENEKELRDYLQLASEETDRHYWYEVAFIDDITLTGSYVFPADTMSYILCAVTLAPGASLELSKGTRNGSEIQSSLYLYDDGSLQICGTLINNGQIYVYTSEGLPLGEEGRYTGSGTIMTFSSYGSAEKLFPWLSRPEYSTYSATEQDYWLIVAPTEELASGDLNRDGVVNSQDLVCLRKLLVGLDTESSYLNADTNGDGTVDILDLVRLAKYLAGENVSLG